MTALPSTALDLAANGLMQDLQIEFEPQSLKARVDLFDEAIVLTHYKEGLPVTAYEVAPIDLASAFGGIPITTGLLPAGCLFLNRWGGQEQVAIYLPAQQRKIVAALAEGERVLTLPLPGLVVFGHAQNYYVFAVRRYPTTEREPLFHAPFSNVNTSGLICRGDVPFPICSASTIQAAAALFLESQFNNHLAGHKSKKHRSNLLDLWRELDGAEDYPLDDLCHSHQTLRSLMTQEGP